MIIFRVTLLVLRLDCGWVASITLNTVGSEVNFDTN